LNCKNCNTELVKSLNEKDNKLCGADKCKYGWYLDNPNEPIESVGTFLVELIAYYLKLHKDYRDIINQLKGNPRMTFNFNPLENERLVNLFNEDPENFPKLVKSAIIRVYYNYGGKDSGASIINREMDVIITDSDSIKLHEWGSDHEGIPLKVECQVIAAGLPETYLKQGEAYCYSCQDRIELLSLGMIPKCRNKDCDRKGTQMIIDQSTVKTGDIQMFRIQEPIAEAQHGTPLSFPCIVKDEFTKSTFVGQRKKVIGVFRSIPQKGKDTNMVTINSISLTDLDEVQDLEPDKETLALFKKLVKKPNFIQILTDSISPELKHEDLAKLCVLIACVGGTQSGRLRGDIHGILVGSPSAGKSTLLEFIPRFNQKSSFINGATMSGTGVTASMDTLPNREKIVRAGAIPLNTGGIVAIDEMNQLEPEDLGKMFEGMETGKIHYNKGGFNVILDARTTIMGGANPKGYEYNFDLSMMDNLSFMPPPMISRFDLITLMESQKSEEMEVDIEDHILLIRKIGVEQFIQDNNLLTPIQLMLFVSHVKKIKPIPDVKTEKLLKDFSAQMRKLQDTQKGMKRVDKRFFESMIRISSAIAKIYMSDIVKTEHAMLAIEVYKSNLSSFHIDTSEGVTVHKQEQFVTGKKSAFETACHRMQSSGEDGRFTESELIKFLSEKYSDYFSNPDMAQKMFDEYYNKAKLGKLNGRYHLE